MWLASVTSLDQTSNCHLRSPRTPQCTRPVWMPTRMFTFTPITSRTSLKIKQHHRHIEQLILNSCVSIQTSPVFLFRTYNYKPKSKWTGAKIHRRVSAQFSHHVLRRRSALKTENLSNEEWAGFQPHRLLNPTTGPTFIKPFWEKSQKRSLMSTTEI